MPKPRPSAQALDERKGVSWGHGSSLRRLSEMAHVKGITTLASRNMGAVGRADYEAAKAYGTHIVSMRSIRRLRRVLERLVLAVLAILKVKIC